jgi:hypothetical protein
MIFGFVVIFDGSDIRICPPRNIAQGRPLETVRGKFRNRSA